MHGFYWSTKRLSKLVEPYVGGQYQVYARSKEVYRGETHKIIVLPNLDVIVHFRWLATRGFTSNEFELKDVKWQRVQRSPSGDLFIRFNYLYYYYQKSKKIIKLKAFGEQSRFHLPEDPTNILKPKKLIISP